MSSITETVSALLDTVSWNRNGPLSGGGGGGRGSLSSSSSVSSSSGSFNSERTIGVLGKIPWRRKNSDSSSSSSSNNSGRRNVFGDRFSQADLVFGGEGEEEGRKRGGGGRNILFGRMFQDRDDNDEDNMNSSSSSDSDNDFSDEERKKKSEDKYGSPAFSSQRPHMKTMPTDISSPLALEMRLFGDLMPTNNEKEAGQGSQFSFSGALNSENSNKDNDDEINQKSPQTSSATTPIADRALQQLLRNRKKSSPPQTATISSLEKISTSKEEEEEELFSAPTATNSRRRGEKQRAMMADRWTRHQNNMARAVEYSLEIDTEDLLSALDELDMMDARNILAITKPSKGKKKMGQYDEVNNNDVMLAFEHNEWGYRQQQQQQQQQQQEKRKEFGKAEFTVDLSTREKVRLSPKLKG